ncbi:restriction endonuclease subunit S [Acidiphilium sp. C61]|uniref:restriction endonuclease subunit S n=1 Tax=Acidiphilium sp. C61 TaxID=1671485 RepID=UPI00157AC055|nr:restriction endonuclease subunit S [Acidiphilium sp. C61]
MGEWTDVSLGTLAAPNNGAIAIGPFGSAMKADTYVPSGVPVIRGTNISNTRAWKGDWVYISDNFADSMPRCVVKPSTLVFPHRGSVGEVALVPTGAYSRYFLSTSLMKIDLDEKKANPLFVYYFFKSRAGREEILKYASQVGTPGIGQPLASLRSFKLPYPPLPIQRGIASILGALDDKIELDRQMNETLEAMARAVFKDWFVDFGPTRAKAEGRPPYLAPEIWSLFPDRLDDEGKPEGWGQRRVEDILELAYGKALKASERSAGPVPVYGSGGVTGYHNEALVEGPSVIIGRKGTVGVLYWEDRPFFPIDTVFYIKPMAPLTFCYYHLQTLGLESMNTDAAVPGLNRNNVYRLPVPWSDDELRNQFDRLVAPLRQRMRSNSEETETLAATRDLLLPKLMSGEIRVRDAEKVLEAMA